MRGERAIGGPSLVYGEPVTHHRDDVDQALTTRDYTQPVTGIARGRGGSMAGWLAKVPGAVPEHLVSARSEAVTAAGARLSCSGKRVGC